MAQDLLEKVGRLIVSAAEDGEHPPLAQRLVPEAELLPAVGEDGDVPVAREPVHRRQGVRVHGAEEHVLGEEGSVWRNDQDYACGPLSWVASTQSQVEVNDLSIAFFRRSLCCQMGGEGGIGPFAEHVSLD